MPLRTVSLTLLLAALGALSAIAQDDLPAPAAAPTKEEEATEETADPVVVGNLEHNGWGLTGSRGRLYFFGGLAMADYEWKGERKIVALQQEEPSLLPKPDEKFLYYRELRDGHRWAIGRHPLSDKSYIIYFQPQTAATVDAAKKPKWEQFERARLEWKR